MSRNLGDLGRLFAQRAPGARFCAVVVTFSSCLGILAAVGCSSSDSSSKPSTDGGDTGASKGPEASTGEGADGGAEGAAEATDAAATTPADAGEADGGMAESGSGSHTGACAEYFGACGPSGSSCCSGLTCLNNGICCLNAGVVRGGSCSYDNECCSNHCEQDAGGLFGTCCNIAGQACVYATDCCAGLSCSNGTCS